MRINLTLKIYEHPFMTVTNNYFGMVKIYLNFEKSKRSLYNKIFPGNIPGKDYKFNET